MEKNINEKPYIEYNGKKYEFEASFRLKRDYDKEFQTYYQKAIITKKLSKEKVDELEELQAFVSEHPDMSIADLDEKQISKFINASDTFNIIVPTSIYEKYCFRMLNESYGIDEATFEKMLEEFGNKYGYAKIDVLLQRACEKVFTQQVESEQEKAPLPEWMN